MSQQHDPTTTTLIDPPVEVLDVCYLYIPGTNEYSGEVSGHRQFTLTADTIDADGTHSISGMGCRLLETVAEAPAPSSPPSTLPETGAETAIVAGMGGVLLIVGALACIFARPFRSCTRGR